MRRLRERFSSHNLMWSCGTSASKSPSSYCTAYVLALTCGSTSLCGSTAVSTTAISPPSLASAGSDISTDAISPPSGASLASSATGVLTFFTIPRNQAPPFHLADTLSPSLKSTTSGSGSAAGAATISASFCAALSSLCKSPTAGASSSGSLIERSMDFPGIKFLATTGGMASASRGTPNSPAANSTIEQYPSFDETRRCCPSLDQAMSVRESKWIPVTYMKGVVICSVS
mmetsp:Transcript_54433/g.79844  ORF Transcript_54433/g.79844 Transcript_54433/m.79844 type:complete len:230 (-) Transcript_54433:201-890(-)